MCHIYYLVLADISGNIVNRYRSARVHYKDLILGMSVIDTLQVFEDTKPIITSCVDGYNVCLIAYGQTGAGKTYTMMGPPNNPGVNIRSMEELFKITKERDKIQYTMRVRKGLPR